MTKKKLLSVLAALAAGVSAMAQSIPAPTTSSSTGLLGQRYVDASFSAQDAHSFSDHAYGLGVAVNLPFNESLDFGLGYDYGWLNSSVDTRSHTLSASATTYTTYNGMKPFFGAALGYGWTRAEVGSFSHKDNNGIWGLGAGVEIPVKAVTLTPSLSYADSFKGGSTGVYAAGLEANHWFTKAVAGFADVSFSDARGHGGEAWNYGVGVRVKF